MLADTRRVAHLTPPFRMEPTREKRSVRAKQGEGWRICCSTTTPARWSWQHGVCRAQAHVPVSGSCNRHRAPPHFGARLLCTSHLPYPP